MLSRYMVDQNLYKMQFISVKEAKGEEIKIGFLGTAVAQQSRISLKHTKLQTLWSGFKFFVLKVKFKNKICSGKMRLNCFFLILKQF